MTRRIASAMRLAETTTSAPSVARKAPARNDWMVEISDTPKGVFPRVVTQIWRNEELESRRKGKPLSNRRRVFYSLVLDHLRQSVAKIEEMLAEKPMRTRYPQIWVIEAEHNQFVLENEGVRPKRTARARTAHGRPMNEAVTQKSGKIVPSSAALERVEIEYPDKSDAEKYRLAQAQTLLNSITIVKKSGKHGR